MTRKRSNIYATDVQRNGTPFRIQLSRVRDQALLARKRSRLARTKKSPRSHGRNAPPSHARATIVWRPRDGTYSRPITTRATHHTARTSTQQTLCATRVWRPSDGTPFQTQRSRARYRHKILRPTVRSRTSPRILTFNHVGGPNASVHHPMAPRTLSLREYADNPQCRSRASR
jgi:hypothetical protein